jgi:hypothetical protein
MITTKTAYQIVILKDGPCIDTGSVPLPSRRSPQIPTAVRKCGKRVRYFQRKKSMRSAVAVSRRRSAFCDGTHVKIRFNGTETASREPYLKQANVFDGPILQLTDLESLCAFARFCDPHGKVWNQVKRTDEPEIRESFIRQVENCPAGRLVAWDKASGKIVEKEFPVSIGLVEDPEQHCSGPLGFEVGLAWSRRTALSMRYASVSRSAAAVGLKTSRSAMALTPL